MSPRYPLQSGRYVEAAAKRYSQVRKIAAHNHLLTHRVRRGSGWSSASIVKAKMAMDEVGDGLNLAPCLR